MPSIAYRGWLGGVNQQLPSDQIGDTEVVAAENVEIDSKANLVTRAGTVDISSSVTGMNSRITSLYFFQQSDESSAVFATEAGDVRRWNSATSWPVLSIDGGAAFSSLPGTATWYWAVFNDKAIAVSGDTTGGTVANAIKIDATTSGATLKDVSADAAQPNMKYIEVMNSRVFVVDADLPNRIVASKLGDAEAADAWSATGIAGFYAANVGGDEGGRITAIKQYRGQLVIFKRRRIYALAFGSPNTDTSQWEIRQLVNNVGCISQNSIQEVLGDLVFLSDEGLMSLQKLLSSGDLASALLSENVPALRGVPRSREDYPSIVIPHRSQYAISIPDVNSGVNEVTWVMDYTLLSVNGRVAFTSWTGGPAGSAFCQVIDTVGDIRVFVAKEITGGSSAIHRYRNDTECAADGAACYQDDGVAYQTAVVFKALNFDEPLVRKRIHRWGMEFEALTDPVALSVFLSIDGNDAKARSWQLSFSGLSTGSLWDDGLWDSATWASEVSTDTDVWRGVGPPSRFQQVQLSVRASEIDQGVAVKNLGVQVSRLTHRRVKDA